MDNKIIRIDLDGVNCYLTQTQQGFLLFDTGGHLVMDKQFTNRRVLLQKELKIMGCTERNLNLIVLTHGDNDHVCNAAYFREKYRANIAMHKEDIELVETPTLHCLMKSFQYRSLAYRVVFRLLKKTITNVTERALNDFETFSPDVLLEDGFSLLSFGLDANVIHIPGHTKGAIAILTKDGDLIAGDMFSNNKKPDIALNADDFRQLHISFNKLKDLPIRTVYPGHGNPFQFTDLKVHYMITKSKTKKMRYPLH